MRLAISGATGFRQNHDGPGLCEATPPVDARQVIEHAISHVQRLNDRGLLDFWQASETFKILRGAAKAVQED
jgi:hypothetical protein